MSRLIEAATVPLILRPELKLDLQQFSKLPPQLQGRKFVRRSSPAGYGCSRASQRQKCGGSAFRTLTTPTPGFADRNSRAPISEQQCSSTNSARLAAFGHSQSGSARNTGTNMTACNIRCWDYIDMTAVPVRSAPRLLSANQQRLRDLPWGQVSPAPLAGNEASKRLKVNARIDVLQAGKHKPHEIGLAIREGLQEDLFQIGSRRRFLDLHYCCCGH